MCKSGYRILWNGVLDTCFLISIVYISYSFKKGGLPSQLELLDLKIILNENNIG